MTIILTCVSHCYFYIFLLQPDYDDIDDEEENRLKLFPTSRGSKDRSKDNKKYGKFILLI